MSSSTSFRSRLMSTDTWLVELFLALYTMIWGLWFANPGIDSFRVGTTSTYAVIALFPGGELAFGVVTTLLGGAKLWALAQWSRYARGYVCCALGVFWLCVAVAVAIPTSAAAAGIPHYALVSLANWYVWVRMSLWADES